MAYDIPPPIKLPDPGYYYHFKHDPGGLLNNYAYYIYGVSATTLKMIAEPKTLSCKYTGLYTRRHMPIGTADSSTHVLCRCFLNRPNGREKRCCGSLESSTQT
jgi:hypothetical protein